MKRRGFARGVLQPRNKSGCHPERSDSAKRRNAVEGPLYQTDRSSERGPSTRTEVLAQDDARISNRYCTVIATGFDAIPFATTYNLLAPVSIPDGTSKFVNVGVFLVCTPIVLWS